MKTFFVLFLALGLVASAGQAQTLNPSPDHQGVKIFQTVTPVFPRELPELGFFEGEARLAIAVDETGKLTDWLVIGYTHRRFAEESVDAVKQWKFEPARVGGKPVSVQIELLINFATSGVVISCDAGTSMQRFANALFKNREAFQPCTMRELDRIPTPRNAVSPAYGEDLANKGVQGTVVVDFFIDETGTLRMPAIKSADYDELASLAVAAMQQWKFEPPTRHGVPVLVRAKQVFHFGLK
jgi:TonB family protein